MWSRHYQTSTESILQALGAHEVSEKGKRKLVSVKQGGEIRLQLNLLQSSDAHCSCSL